MKKVQPALYTKEFKKLGEDCKKWAETAPTEAERKDFLAVAKSCESHSVADGGRVRRNGRRNVMGKVLLAASMITFLGSVAEG
jgi:hypothetical protein